MINLQTMLRGVAPGLVIVLCLSIGPGALASPLALWERWLSLHGGLAVDMQVAAGGQWLGPGQIFVRKEVWGQVLPRTNAVGQLLVVHSLWFNGRLYTWSESLGIGVVTPFCPGCLLLGTMLSNMPGGERLIPTAAPDDSYWQDSRPSVKISTSAETVENKTVWTYTWPFPHDPEIEQSMEVILRGVGPVPASHTMHSVSFYLADYVTEFFSDWQVRRSVDPKWLQLPDDIDWELMTDCPHPDKPPVWWEWGL